MNKDKQVRSTVLVTSISAILLNLIQSIKFYNETYENIAKFLGGFGLNALHVSTLIAIFAAIAVLAITLIKHRHMLKRASWLLVVGGLVIAGTAANVLASELKAPEDRLQHKIREWSKTIHDSALPNGALPIGTNIPEAQVWTDAQLLKGLLINAQRERKLIDGTVLRKTFEWIETQRRADGWTYYSNCQSNEPTVTEITAWVLVAEFEALSLQDFWKDTELGLMRKRIDRDIAELLRRQLPNGGFTPILSGKTNYCRTYSTLMALHALAEYRKAGKTGEDEVRIRRAIQSAIGYLASTYQTNIHSWVPNAQRSSQKEGFPGLTAQVLYVLSECNADDFSYPARQAFLLQCKDFVHNAEIVAYHPSRNQRMHDNDQHIHSEFFSSCFQLEASTYLGYPWILATTTRLRHIDGLQDEKERILRLRASFLSPDMVAKGIVAVENELFYVWAENLIGYGTALEDTEPTTAVHLLTSQLWMKLGILAIGVVSGGMASIGLTRRQERRNEDADAGFSPIENPAQADGI